MARSDELGEAAQMEPLPHGRRAAFSRDISEEERRWLAEAVERHMAEDVVGCLREIALLMRTPLSVLEAQGITPEDIEDLLAELQVHVESIDIANALIRNNKPGVAAFRLANGYAGLRDALSSESARFQRKALSLTHYLLSESHSDCSVFAQLGFPRLMMRLVSSDDSGVREAALGGLLELAKDTTLGNRSLLAEQDRLWRLLWGSIQSIRMMAPEDLDVDERKGNSLTHCGLHVTMSRPRFTGKDLLFCLGRNPLNNLLMWLVDSSSHCAGLHCRGHLLVLMRDQIQEMESWEELCCF
ncbi:hypothetical protein ZWY2020_035964 [Hordeum vulgare]|nr:hypothetical protein ZWY2020_035964 [Hordeum vulgare]